MNKILKNIEYNKYKLAHLIKFKCCNIKSNNNTENNNIDFNFVNLYEKYFDNNNIKLKKLLKRFQKKWNNESKYYDLAKYKLNIKLCSKINSNLFSIIN